MAHATESTMWRTAARRARSGTSASENDEVSSTSRRTSASTSPTEAGVLRAGHEDAVLGWQLAAREVGRDVGEGALDHEGEVVRDRSRAVRRQHDRVERAQALAHHRLAREGVESGTSEPTARECVRERVLVDESTARAVHDDGPLAQLSDAFGAQQVRARRRVRDVEGDDVRGGEQLVEADEAQAEAPLRGARGAAQVGVEEEDLEGAKALRDLGTDVAETDEPDRLGPQLPLEGACLLLEPLAGAHHAVRAGEAPERREDEHDDVLGDGGRVHAGETRDRDAPLPAALEIHLVDADAELLDEAEARRRLEDRAGHGGLDDEDRVCASGRRGLVVGARGGRAGELPARREACPELAQEPLVERVEQPEPHRSSSGHG